tara:strand:+ start:153 stop:503 length:351 start_codon:yes stop_codon:yes gene_type:complete
MNYSQIKSKDLQGVDVSKEITLKEYGFAYHVLPRKGIYRLYIGGTYSLQEEETGEFNYTEWEALELPLTVKIEEEFDFIEVKDVASFCGMNDSKWLALDAPAKLFDAISYYGSENF